MLKLYFWKGRSVNLVTVVDRNVQLDEEKSLNQIQLVT